MYNKAKHDLVKKSTIKYKYFFISVCLYFFFTQDKNNSFIMVDFLRGKFLYSFARNI